MSRINTSEHKSKIFYFTPQQVPSRGHSVRKFFSKKTLILAPLRLTVQLLKIDSPLPPLDFSPLCKRNTLVAYYTTSSSIKQHWSDLYMKYLRLFTINLVRRSFLIVYFADEIFCNLDFEEMIESSFSRRNNIFFFKTRFRCFILIFKDKHIACTAFNIFKWSNF